MYSNRLTTVRSAKRPHVMVYYRYLLIVWDKKARGTAGCIDLLAYIDL